jgi:hypothetical protein
VSYPSLHRKEQYDLDCFPWLCIHWHGENYSKRIFCIWSGGIQIGNWYRYNRKSAAS